MCLLNILRLGRLARERRGSMLVEFSLVLPGFFVILFGGLAIADALSAYNRMQNIATTVGIMASRLKNLSNKDMVGIAAAARGYMFPFPSKDLSILVASVWVDDTGAPTLRWCERWNRTSGKGGTCSGTVAVGGTDFGYWEYATDLTVDDLDLEIPAGIQNPSTGLVVVKVTYDWTAPYAPMSLAQMTSLTMGDTFFYSPRADVTLTPPTRDRTSPSPTSSYKVRQ